MSQLSQHFTLEELIASDTAARLGLDNTPDEDQVKKLEFLASQLELVREVTGALHVNSGYRSPAVNTAVGSKDTSQHCKCEAADLKSLAGHTPLELCRMVRDSTLQFDQLIYEFDAWMHLSFVIGKTPRRSVLTIDKAGTRAGIA